MKGAVLNLEELNGKSLALLLGGEDDDWSTLRGTVRQDGESLMLDQAGGQSFMIQPEWIERIKSVPEDLSDIFMGAHFFLPLSVGALPEDADPNDYIHAGLKLE
jgi:hypothetical protein